MKAISALAGAGFMAVALQAMAHGGGLDASGCHHNRRTGDYHCHRAQVVQAQPPSSQADVGDVRSGLQQPQASITPQEPTCHVAPRGCTYTRQPDRLQLELQRVSGTWRGSASLSSSSSLL